MDHAGDLIDEVLRDPDAFVARIAVNGISEKLVAPDRPQTASAIGIPPIYESADFRDFKPGDSDPDIDPNLEPCDLLIHGENGRGKTHLAAAYARHWGARWCQTSRFLAEVRSTYGRRGGESELEVLTRYTDPARLVIDDITACSSTDHARGTLLALLDHRITHMKATIVTCYQGFAAVQAFDPSVASRLSAFRRIRMLGADRRASYK